MKTETPAYTVPAAQKVHPNMSVADYMNVGPEPGPEMSEMERSAFTILSMGGMGLAQAKAEARRIAKIREPERFAAFAQQQTGHELAAQQFRKDDVSSSAPTARQTPTAKALAHWSAPKAATATPPKETTPTPAQKALSHWTPAPKGPTLTYQEKLDAMGVALASETAEWIGSAKSQKEITKAADSYLAREVPSLSASERTAVATLAAEGVEHFRAEEQAARSAKLAKLTGGNGPASSSAAASVFDKLRAKGWKPGSLPGSFRGPAKSQAAAATSPTTAVEKSPDINPAGLLELETLRASNRMTGGIGAAVQAGVGIQRPGLFGAMRAKMASLLGF